MTPITCEEVVAHMSMIVDGEAPASKRMLFWAHLAICGPCREYYRQFVQVHRAAGQVAPDALPEDFASVMSFVLRNTTEGER